MAEINDAYAALTRDGGRTGARWSGPDVGASDAGPSGDASRGTRTSTRGGPPKPKPSRPVTARVDTTGNVRPRNQTYHQAGAAAGPILSGQPPVRPAAMRREPPRASTPTGPLARSRLRDFRRPMGPPLQDALGLEVGFGKFHGHTLGQIASFEPSYIDWLSATITRDPDLMAAARVVRDDLDLRQVARRPRTTVDAAGSRGRTA